MLHDLIMKSLELESSRMSLPQAPGVVLAEAAGVPVKGRAMNDTRPPGDAQLP